MWFIKIVVPFNPINSFEYFYSRLEMLNSSSIQVVESIQLAQSDLLVSLKTLASIPYLDVRNDTINGLYALLQEGLRLFFVTFRQITSYTYYFTRWTCCRRRMGHRLWFADWSTNFNDRSSTVIIFFFIWFFHDLKSNYVIIAHLLYCHSLLGRIVIDCEHHYRLH